MLADHIRLKKFIAMYLLFYFAAGLVARGISGQEIFPFFSWFLFDKVPNIKHKYMVRITNYKNEELKHPKFFSDAGGIVKDPHSVVADSLIGYFATSYIKKQDEVEGDKLRLLFEKNFLETDTDYELVRIKYNPLVRWKTGKIIEVKKLETFSTRKE